MEASTGNPSPGLAKTNLNNRQSQSSPGLSGGEKMSLLIDIIIILGLSLGVVYLFHRLGIPSIVGFLLTGALAGPNGLGLIANMHEVELMAEMGVVLLLFTIGLEFSLKKLLRIKVDVLAGGALQVGGAVALAFMLAGHKGFAWNSSLFLGFLVALSSTAIVLKLLQDRSALESPAGRLCLAVLIFQDLVVVPMMLVVPFLSGGGGGEPVPWHPLLIKGLVVMGVLVAGGRWLVPRAMARVAATRSREMFLLMVVALCLGIAVLTWWAGLSLALGAFAAGLIISSSPFGLQAVGSVLPMRDLFTSLFFVSIGMLIDPSYVWSHMGLVLGVTGLVLAIKLVTTGGSILLLGHGLRTAGAAGLALMQVGEFSFVLSRLGLQSGLLSQDVYNLFLATAVLTMMSTPLFLSAGFRLGERTPGWISAVGLGRLWAGSWRKQEKEQALAEPPQVVVVGLGLAGRNVVKAAQLAGISYLVVELNPHTVRRESEAQVNIIYGDASNPTVLEHAGLKKARVLVVSMGDSLSIRNITAVARALNPAIHIITRTRWEHEVEELKKLGADEVVPEEYETSLEIFTRVLRHLLIPEEEIAPLLAQLRKSDYDSLREVALGCGTERRLEGLLEDVEISTFRLERGSPLAGTSLAQSDLRSRHGINVVALRREGQVLASPGGQDLMEAGDLVVVMGDPEKVAEAATLFRGVGPRHS